MSEQSKELKPSEETEYWLELRVEAVALRQRKWPIGSTKRASSSHGSDDDVFC
jgi:hypothetical protein